MPHAGQPACFLGRRWALLVRRLNDLQGGMFLRHRTRALMVAGCLLALAPGARAQTTATNVFSWDCWIGTEGPVTIRCIQDRDNLPRADKFNSDLETFLLDNIHSRIHLGETAELDRLVRDNLKVFQEGSIWTIQIHNIPYDISWSEQRPQRLVRAVLCPPGYECPVLLRRPR